MKKETPQQSHQWKFFRSGGVNQVILAEAEDLRNLHTLDLKLWMALSVPTCGVEFDPATAAFLDTDTDGSIRPHEILEAVQWICAVLKEPGQILKSDDGLDLDAIKDPELLASAKRILVNLGKMGQSRISMEEIAAASSALDGALFNGDGILHVEAVDTELLRRAMEDILAAMGSVDDRSGKPGIDRNSLDAFSAQAEAYLSWRTRVQREKELCPLGPEPTAAAAKALEAVEAKVDDYFARCRLIAFDSRASLSMNREETDYRPIGLASISADAHEIADFPLGLAEAGKPLSLEGPLNPAWTPAMAALAEFAVKPILGTAVKELDEADWLKIKASLSAYRRWMAERPTGPVSEIPHGRLEAFFQNGISDKLRALIDRDLSFAEESLRQTQVEKLLRFRRDLGPLLCNYVNFADFYSGKNAIFQLGTLYLDARSCSLCVDASNEALHASLAGLSGAFLVYCDICETGGRKRKIAAVFTDGDSDSIIAGRNGVFIDRSGHDWNATVAKVVLNPVSVRQAFWLPYKKFFRMIEEQVSKRAKAADEAASAKLSSVAGSVASADAALPKPAPAAPKKLDLGTIALIGTAIGGVSALVAGLLQTIFGLGLWLPVGILGLILLISGPSMILAALKLRKRNLGPLLDANGWAINTKALVNIPFGATMTSLASLPPGTLPLASDPFAQKKPRIGRWIFLFILLALLGLGIAWGLGAFDARLPDGWSFTAVWGRLSQAMKPPKVDLQGLVPGSSPLEPAVQ